MVVMIHWLQLEDLCQECFLADDPALLRRQTPESMRLSVNHIPPTSYFLPPTLPTCRLLSYRPLQ